MILLSFLYRVHVKLILLLRDPRKHIIALLRATNRIINSENINWEIINFNELLFNQSRNKAFLKYKDINEYYNCYLRWLKEYPHAYITFFEQLVGNKGGGSILMQRNAIQKISVF